MNSLPLSEFTPIAGVQMRLLDDAGRDVAPAAAPHVALDTARGARHAARSARGRPRPFFSTFEAWLRAGGSATAAAASLFCHPNTVRYRLRRIEAYTGRSLNDPGGWACLRFWSERRVRSDMPKTPADLEPAPERLAAVLRERIYGAITCLSTLVILVRHVGPDSAPSTAAVDVAVDGGALWAASLFADYVSHMVAHGRGPRGSEIAHGLRASGQILEAFAVPLLLLVLASLGLIPFGAALWSGIWITIGSLGRLHCSPPAASPRRTGSGRCSLWYCWRWARSW